VELVADGDATAEEDDGAAVEDGVVESVVGYCVPVDTFALVVTVADPEQSSSTYTVV